LYQTSYQFKIEARSKGGRQQKTKEEGQQQQIKEVCGDVATMRVVSYKKKCGHRKSEYGRTSWFLIDGYS